MTTPPVRNSDQSTAGRAIELAAELLREAISLQTPQERRQQAELDRMVESAEDKATMVEMTDQAFRTHTPARVADQLTHLLDVQGVPRFFSPVEQAMLKGFQSFGEYLPGVAVPLVKEKMRRETANVILPAEPELLAEHLKARQAHGVSMNVNLLGEAILGEEETKRRMQQCFEALRMPEVKCLSVKISTVYSQVSALARQHTIRKVSDRMETLYRTAMQEIDPDTERGKFVYLDMEEYRDLYLTAEVLQETLDRKGLDQVRAGIALQAYVPDSARVMRDLIDWSAKRVAAGGEPLTIRLVKGANMEMERVHASVMGHPQAPYEQKTETDANYKRMLRELIDAAANQNLRVGVASHNLFDVALALVWTADRDLGDRIQIEMLEGMANHQRRALTERGSDMLLYAPACRRDGFLNAIGYLIRRLDENTGPQNFLRHAYRLQPGTPEFDSLADDFRRSFALSESISDAPRHEGSRFDEPTHPSVAPHWSLLVNEPDTDWSIPANADWASKLLETWQAKCNDAATTIPLEIGGQSCDGETTIESADPSRPDVVIARAKLASVDQIRQSVTIADQDKSGWRSSTIEHRHALLRAVAQKLRERRGDLMGAMVADGGKTVPQADPEVSEAIDFCEFYPLTVREWLQHPTIQLQPRGVVAVITPWNFPLAIPCGGIAAALAAGNTVILKPASQTILTAALLCEAFWDAGVPKDVLQLVPCSGKNAQTGLVENPLVDTVILTGGTETAKRMLSVRSDLHLLAETGGKNATIVTALADRDQAIKHVISSAFGHGGQKCSATSLLLLEDEVFHDETFRDTLADAVESLRVGSAWDLSTSVGPLIGEPSEELTRGMKTLQDDESWLVVPEHIDDNPNLYRPGVKWNIRPGSFTHLTELFGPVLGVMRYSRLEEAIEIVRSTGYGLTSGIESLDDREVELWQQSIGAGNLYINRPTTGAIVLRQPFGGVGLSAYGPGVKAGGPHYVLPLMQVVDGNATLPVSDAEHDELDRVQSWVEVFEESGVMSTELADDLQRVVGSQRAAVDAEFSREHDTVQLVGQDNLRRYRPVRAMTIRVDAQEQLRDALVCVTAAVAVRAQVTLSIDPRLPETIKELLQSPADYVPGLVEPLEETIAQLAARVVGGDVKRLRVLTSDTDYTGLQKVCAEQFVTMIYEPVLSDGRIECLRYLDEQSVSNDYHRYGNLGRRANEQRSDVK
ncbi:bifunctional proline dehydrogenase/L-glutamate gamma-semialdehyde dehydrogenase [Planctomycetes bacterium K23_9]|uniref:L-glutamate gamma-semialdehyde dehydrogenase n=1 Tax=Stieleria marina TaxID=1930275 RepID=A0A517NP46_9BACT|nr:Bifunctional protein PutA [Planctomycetes bacterium K23_9]